MKAITTENNIEKFKKKVPKEALALSEIFTANKHKLYIVGGYIRDYFLKIKTEDIDICGTATPQQLEELLSNTDFKFTIINKNLGTYKIYKSNSKIEFEYTTLREEKYQTGHIPSEVNFVDDVLIDAQRRDFTVNTIYYDFSNSKFIDPYNGLQDCYHRVLKPINHKVFDSDGLRIMRLVRFAYTKKMKIPKDVFDSAHLRVYLLRDIAHERIAQEMGVIAEYQKNIPLNDICNIIKYGDERINLGVRNEKALFSALDLLDALMSLGIIDYIFPKLSFSIDMNKIYTTYTTPILSYQFFEYNFGLALTYYICKTLTTQNYELSIEFYQELFGVDGLMLSKLYLKEMVLTLDGLLTLNKMRDESFYVNFIQMYYSVLPEIMYYGKLISNHYDSQCERLITTNSLMKANNIPRCIKELAIKAKDIINRWPLMPQKYISSLLECAMIVATKDRCNEKEYLLNELGKFIVREEV